MTHPVTGSLTSEDVQEAVFLIGRANAEAAR